MGRSAGIAPLRILSTKHAPCLTLAASVSASNEGLLEGHRVMRSKNSRRRTRYHGTGWLGVSTIEMAVTISLLGWMPGGESGLSDTVADNAMPVVMS